VKISQKVLGGGLLFLTHTVHHTRTEHSSIQHAKQAIDCDCAAISYNVQIWATPKRTMILYQWNL